MTARTVRDEITGRNYEATSGAAVVLDPTDGSVVAMASYPTYDPGIWVGGVTARQLKRLYSKRAGEPLLSRPTQGQLAPGSTFKPFMAAGALAHGFDTDTRLNCSSSLRVGNRDFKNFESGATATSASTRRSAVLQHLLLPGRLRAVAARRRRRRRA
jgi:penicillin-binding protein 2